VTTDLTARVAELASLIARGLAEDEAAALAATEPNEDGGGGASWDDEAGSGVSGNERPIFFSHSSTPTAAQNVHIARNDPARRLRGVKATRDLVAAVLTEGHYYAEVGYYSCSQAREGFGLASGLTGPPGSGCSDPERAGQPCDCGRDMHVARLLGIIASEWED
jgi:hypothetical protein